MVVVAPLDGESGLGVSPAMAGWTGETRKVADNNERISQKETPGLRCGVLDWKVKHECG